MKLRDFAFKFPGYNATSLCRVRLYQNENKLIAICSDALSLGTGLSVTNGVERIRDKLVSEEIIDLDTTIIEHYENSIPGNSTFDIVTFNDEGNLAGEKVVLMKSPIYVTQKKES